VKENKRRSFTFSGGGDPKEGDIPERVKASTPVEIIQRKREKVRVFVFRENKFMRVHYGRSTGIGQLRGVRNYFLEESREHCRGANEKEGGTLEPKKGRF